MNSAPILIQPDIITLSYGKLTFFVRGHHPGASSLISVARAELPPKSQRRPFAIAQFAGRVMADTIVAKKAGPDSKVAITLAEHLMTLAANCLDHWLTAHSYCANR